ncbi:MAG: endonuclease/exonuclease/phosphatase family protein [Elusimicrobiota bacterium]
MSRTAFRLLVGTWLIGWGPIHAVGREPSLKVLTLNLCADWNAPRKARLQAVADFARDNRIDVLLVQEAVQGIGQGDAVRFLADRLGYSFRQVPAFGVPVFFKFNIGVISRFPITESKPLGCRVPGGDAIDNIPNPGGSRALAVRAGGLWFVTCHLTTPFTQENHEKQVRGILEKLDGLPAGDVFWGGDFNSGRGNPVYALITKAGFKEAPPAESGLVDMVFYRGRSWRLTDSRLVLTGRYVTDHPGGVLATYSADRAESTRGLPRRD